MFFYIKYLRKKLPERATLLKGSREVRGHLFLTAGGTKNTDSEHHLVLHFLIRSSAASITIAEKETCQTIRVQPSATVTRNKHISFFEVQQRT
jgi:hypothetical protein